MAATADQIRRSIEPGSIPQGDRQVLESRLGQVGAQQATPNPRSAQAAASPGLGIPSNPLDPLLGGRLPKDSDDVTAGLSVGPGAGPGGEQIPDGRIERLRMVALQAQSPVVREMARRALRSTVRSRRGR